MLTAGVFSLVTAAFLLKGLRNAWWFAVVHSVISLVGNITKAIDFEEAFFALFVLILLLSTKKEYYKRTNPRLRTVGLQTALLAVVATLLYGVIGFYFLDKKQFNVDFSFWESIKFTLYNFFLVGSPELVPVKAFARILNLINRFARDRGCRRIS